VLYQTAGNSSFFVLKGFLEEAYLNMSEASKLVLAIYLMELQFTTHSTERTFGVVCCVHFSLKSTYLSSSHQIKKGCPYQAAFFDQVVLITSPASKRIAGSCSH
jgi:hypothetical protein